MEAALPPRPEGRGTHARNLMEFVASLDSLDEIMGYIRKEAERLQVEERQINKIELACEEAIVNIISYAYPDRKGKLIVGCEKRKGRFDVILRDHGLPFNPIESEVNPQLDKPIQERKIGGLGIFLFRKIIDEASYQRVENENVLRLFFSLKDS